MTTPPSRTNEINPSPTGEHEAVAREVKAIVRLLDDPDSDVQTQVEQRLVELGREAFPALREAYNAASGPLRDRIDDALQSLHWNDVRMAWHAVMSVQEPDLERGAFLIALHRYPDLDVESYLERLDDWAFKVRPRIEHAKGVGRARELIEFVSDDLGFSGNRRQYEDPNNSHLNRVIDRRIGIPISLSVVALLLARRLNIPLYGVGMPAHFLVKYSGARGEVYFDLFNDGQPVSREECVRFLLRAGIQPKPSYFEAADTTSILLRMLRNLRHLAQENGNTRVFDQLTELAAPYDPALETE